MIQSETSSRFALHATSRCIAVEHFGERGNVGSELGNYLLRCQSRLRVLMTR
jgi:hypothetical protein